MMLTEDEASLVDCCGPRVANSGQYAGDDDTPHCVGSLCMAWRWESLPRYMVARGSLSDAELETLLADPHWGGVIEYRDDPAGGKLPVPVERRGYCGLAGKP